MRFITNNRMPNGLNAHIDHEAGRKTVCVSHCLAWFNINPSQYTYTSSNKNRTAYENVLRRFGWSVRSRMTEFKVRKNGSTTLTALRSSMRKSKYNSQHFFIVLVHQQKAAHLIVLDGRGETVVDTAKNKKWKVESVKQVF